MFDLFSWSHILILLVVALVVVGPKDLPRMMHMAGKWAGKARAMANEFRKSFDEMARQAELDELRKEIDDLKKNNPITDITNSMSEVQAAIDTPVAAPEERAGETPVQAATDTPMAAPEDGAGETPAQAAPSLEDNIEPRSGELEVTQTIPAKEPSTP
jgi:sec-independent protein translocase protein TatB